MVHVTIKSKTNNWINEQEVVVIHSQEWLNYTKSKKRLQNEYGILRNPILLSYVTLVKLIHKNSFRTYNMLFIYVCR